MIFKFRSRSSRQLSMNRPFARCPRRPSWPRSPSASSPVGVPFCCAALRATDGSCRVLRRVLRDGTEIAGVGHKRSCTASGSRASDITFPSGWLGSNLRPRTSGRNDRLAAGASSSVRRRHVTGFAVSSGAIRVCGQGAAVSFGGGAPAPPSTGRGNLFEAAHSVVVGDSRPPNFQRRTRASAGGRARLRAHGHGRQRTPARSVAARRAFETKVIGALCWPSSRGDLVLIQFVTTTKRRPGACHGCGDDVSQ